MQTHHALVVREIAHRLDKHAFTTTSTGTAGHQRVEHKFRNTIKLVRQKRQQTRLGGESAVHVTRHPARSLNSKYTWGGRGVNGVV